MIYLKSIIAGVVGAVATMLLSAILVALGAFVWLQFEMWRQQVEGTGGIGAVSAGFAEGPMAFGLIVLGAAGFVAGFRRQFRRRHTQPA